MATRSFKIGELAELTTTTTRTLRYYEELGLLEPIRNNSGQRLYGEDALTRLSFINELKSGGFALLEIKNFFESWQQNKTGAEAAEATMTMIQQKLLEITQMQKQLSKLNDELRAMVSFLIACKTCEQKPSKENCSPCSKHPHQETPHMLVNILKKESAIA